MFIMKQQISKPENVMLNKQYKDHDDKKKPSANEFNKPNFYVLTAYSNPFIPVADLSFAIEELVKMIKTRKHKNTYQKQIK